MLTSRLLVLAAPLVAAVLAGSALGYVCHPAAPGTRVLVLSAPVRSVAVHGRLVAFVVAGRRGCSRVTWSTANGSVHRGPANCASRPSQGAGLSVGVDVRGRSVLRVGRRELLLPAFARAATAGGGIALVQATRPDGGVFAVRLRDGAFTYLGPNGRSFAPQIDSRGAVFHDGEDKRALRAGRTMAVFVPRRVIAQGFAKTTAPVTIEGRIQGFSMDGLRVALAVGDRGARCDRVLYWNVAWRPVQRISAPSARGSTCLPGVGRTRIPMVAVGGFRAEWLASSRSGLRLIAGSPRCQEWVVHRLAGQRLTGLAADRATVAYATTRRDTTSLGVVDPNWRERRIATRTGSPLSLAADHTRVAALWPDGTVEVWTTAGGKVAQLHVGAARTIALERNRLAVLRGSHLDVYDLERHRRVRSYPAPGASGLDLQYGIAAFARGHEAVVLDTATGRTAVVGRAPKRLLGVQIEGPGLAYAWTGSRTGVARFVPTIQLDRALGR